MTYMAYEVPDGAAAGFELVKRLGAIYPSYVFYLRTVLASGVKSGK